MTDPPERARHLRKSEKAGQTSSYPTPESATQPRHALHDPEPITPQSSRWIRAQAGKDLVVAALADDGVVEATEHPHRWVVAVQWHPEDPAGSAEQSAALFGGFAAACAQARPR
ncbi:gamma-glutamyl-gamma-aminobutyrate hydrolase family protein [Streptomyces sp. NPDC057582]|uniref:gamma-glutamyl-gamma-aminobutyrate hydrolase family protein n=1 Tax=Streptomyces sp. NPDC057582 TaxID=3346174 RepID=UPI0036D05F5A